MNAKKDYIMKTLTDSFSSATLTEEQISIMPTLSESNRLILNIVFNFDKLLQNVAEFMQEQVNQARENKKTLEDLMSKFISYEFVIGIYPNKIILQIISENIPIKIIQINSKSVGGHIIHLENMLNIPTAPNAVLHLQALIIPSEMKEILIDHLSDTFVPKRDKKDVH